MNLKILFIGLCITLGTNTSMWAQINDLSKEDIEAFKERAGEAINTFQKNLEIIGSKEQSQKVKAHYKKGVLKLFMGEGEPYQDANNNTIRAVSMQISSFRQNKAVNVTTLTLKKYLERLVSLSYAKVEITKADTYRISNFYKVNDHYEATATIFQTFCGYDGEGRKLYCDKTQKNIKVYITPERDGVLGDYWSVRLGDIEVAETQGFE